MKERPIIFSTPMVKAINAGNKWQTRRTSGLEQMNENPDRWIPVPGQRFIDDLGRLNQEFINIKNESVYAICPYGMPTAVLWVRETFSKYRGFAEDLLPNAPYIYKADEDECGQFPIIQDDVITYVNARESWKPSIHMPHAAARIFLKIFDMGVERLNAISEDDALNEGIRGVIDRDGVCGFVVVHFYYHTAKEAFSIVWENINGPGSWSHNPWVWKIKFTRIRHEKAIQEMSL